MPKEVAEEVENLRNEHLKKISPGVRERTFSDLRARKELKIKLEREEAQQRLKEIPGADDDDNNDKRREENAEGAEENQEEKAEPELAANEDTDEKAEGQDSPEDIAVRHNFCSDSLIFTESKELSILTRLLCM